jgi:hypothetical protein
MKLFQIEEPEGPPLDETAPGAAVGMAVRKGAGAVAIAVGGNAEILPGADGARFLEESDLAALLLGLRARAEKQLARPVTHAVIAAPAIEAALVTLAAQEAGLQVLDLVDGGTDTIEHAALAAAVRAEDLGAKTV